MSLISLQSRPLRRGMLSTVIAAFVAVAVFGSGQIGAAAESVAAGSVRPTGAGSGPYQWGEHITLQGFDWDGKRTSINTAPAGKDKVIGVSGGRWGRQIDYTSANGGKSESLVVSFARPVSNVTLEIGMIGAAEGGKDGSAPIDEAGKWTALGRDGKVVGLGIISPVQSAEGPRVRKSGSYGLYPIAVRASEPIHKIRIEAIAWRTTTKSFDDTPVPGTAAGGGANNSDIGLHSVRFSFASSVPADFPTTTTVPTTTPTTEAASSDAIVVVPAQPKVAQPQAAQSKAAQSKAPQSNKDASGVVKPSTTTSAPSAPAAPAAPKKRSVVVGQASAQTPEAAQGKALSGRFVLDAADLSVSKNVGRWDGASIGARGFDRRPAALSVRKGVVAPAGGRYKTQLDADTKSDRSEQLVIDFDTPVEVNGFSVRYLESAEYKGLPETGVWWAFDADGEILMSRKFAGSDVAAVNGIRSFATSPVSGVSRLVFEATHYGHGSRSDRTDNQSDFALKSITGRALPASFTAAKTVEQPTTITIAPTITPTITPTTAAEPLGEAKSKVTARATTTTAATSTSTTEAKSNEAVEPVAKHVAVPTAGWPTNSNGDLPYGGVFYGMAGSGAYGPANTSIALEHSIRFRAEKSGAIDTVSYQNRLLEDIDLTKRCTLWGPDSDWCTCVNAGLTADVCGYTLGNSYHVGNGGKIKIKLYADDGTANHRPDLTKQLGEVAGTYIPTDFKDGAFPDHRLAKPVQVKAGGIYHIVLTNLAPPPGKARQSIAAAKAMDPNVGAISLNGVLYAESKDNEKRFGPYFGRHGKATLFRNSKNGSWSERGTHAWWEVRYTDGTWIGETWGAWDISFGADGTRIVEGKTKARQKFTVQDATRRVNGLWLNYGHAPKTPINGKPLTIEVKNAAGSVVATGRLAADPATDAISKKAAGKFDHMARTWAYTDLSSTVNLVQGETYTVEFSAPTGAGFALSAMPYKTKGLGHNNRNLWVNSQAELSTNGGTSWSSYHKHYQDRDLSVLFTIEGMPKQIN